MLINKKKILVILGTILIAISTHAYGTDTGVITGETVKLRDGASLEAKLVTLLSVNNKVEVLGQEGDWYKVTYKDYTGYVYKDYVKVDKKETVENTENEEPVVDDAVEAENTSTEENIQTNNENTEDIVVPSEKVIQEDSTISIIPLINSSQVAVLKKDTKVTVIEYKNGWAYVIASNANGWIRKEKLQKSEVIQTSTQQQETETTQPEETQETTSENLNKIGYVNVSSVRVRKVATTDSEILENLVKNDKVTILQELDKWYKVKVNNIEGYIAKPYLSDKEVKVTSRSSVEERNFKENEIAEGNTTIVKDEVKETSSTKKKNIVEYAKTFLGCKYVLGGSTPETGLDCSGFTYYVYKKFGYSLNRTSSTQAKNGIEVSKSNLELGDLVFFSQDNKAIGHVGIYIGGNKFIHAANEKKGVVITSLSNSYYTENYVTARRIIN